MCIRDRKDKARQRKTEEKVERRPVVAPRYESGGEAQALVRPARDRGLPLGGKGKNRNSLACFRNAGSYSVATYCINEIESKRRCPRGTFQDREACPTTMMVFMTYYVGERLRLERETENSCV